MSVCHMSDMIRPHQCEDPPLPTCWASLSCRCYVRLLNFLHDLGESLATNVLAFQDSVNRVMTDARLPLQFANPGLQYLVSDFVARNYLFRAVVLDGLKFNKTQVFTLFPSPVGFLSHVSTRSCMSGLLLGGSPITGEIGLQRNNSPDTGQNRLFRLKAASRKSGLAYRIVFDITPEFRRSQDCSEGGS